jgi:hypothetical protein
MEVVCPKNCILYAVDAEYSPSLPNFHLMESGMLLYKLTICVISQIVEFLNVLHRKPILGVQIVDPKIILKSFLDGAQSSLGNFEN